jgi:ribosomal protein S18 acetylase RimI-like enzyme
MFKVKKSGLIADIFIEDNCRRKGAGNKLIEVCFDWFKQNNISFIEISVEVSNDKAMNFWNKNGFKDVSIEKIKKI